MRPDERELDDEIRSHLEISVRERIARGEDPEAARLAAFNADAGGSSRRIERFRLLKEPASMDAGELTDKGYVNQRRVLERRADLVADLYREPPGPGVDCVA